MRALPELQRLAPRGSARRTVVDRCDLARVCLPAYRSMLSGVMGAPV
jgi:hypothetical protein